MFQSLEVTKTHEIMARFRPIAPKPLFPPSVDSPEGASAAAAALHLQPRPCRARKRGRAAGLAPLPNKRHKGFLPLLPNNSHMQTFSCGLNFSLIPPPPIGTSADLLTFSLIPNGDREVGGPPVERDLLKKLQEPRVIVPQPMRPVGSSITVGCINEHSITVTKPPVLQRSKEVEEEVESESLPAVVSDSNNRVRLANSAYKEMVGQPECPWLDSMVSAHHGGELGLKATSAASRRINGEVMLDLSESLVIPASSKGFSCRVKIQWACNGKKSFVDAPCDVIRLYCDSKDYMFTWKFHTAEAFETNCKA